MIFGQKIWNYYASWYDKLWVQKFVLKPSRNLILKTMTEITSFDTVLDFGCGIGELCRDINDHYPTAKILGIDPSTKMIERAKKETFNDNIRFKSGFVMDLPEKTQYDLIVSTNAFPYVMDKKESLEKIHKLLKPNGRLLLLFANNNNLYDALWLMFVKLSTSKAQYLSVASTKTLLQVCGFSIGRVERINGPFLLPSVYMIEGIANKNL